MYTRFICMQAEKSLYFIKTAKRTDKQDLLHKRCVFVLLNFSNNTLNIHSCIGQGCTLKSCAKPPKMKYISKKQEPPRKGPQKSNE